MFLLSENYIYFLKDMKFAGLAMRFSTLFAKRMPAVNLNKFNKLAITTTGFGIGFAYWASQNKVMAE